MKKFLRNLMFLCAAMTFALAACGESGEAGRTKNAKIKFLHIWPEHSATIQKIVNDFMAENEDISIEVQQCSYEDVQTMLNSQIVTQSLPDIFFYWTNQLQGYIDAGVLLDLKPYTDGWMETYVDEGALSWELAKRGNSYYSVPFRESGNVLVYNKTLFEEKGLKVPETYQEFETLLKTAREFSPHNSYCPVAVSGTNGGYLVDFYYMLNDFHTLLQKRYEDPHYKIGLIDDSDDAEIQSAAKRLDKITDLYRKGYFGQAEGKSDSTAVRNFKEGNAAMVYMNYNNIALLGDVEFEYGFFTVPAPAGVDYHYLNFDYDGFCVAKNTKNADACIRFLKYLTRKDVITDFANATHSIAPIKEVEYEKDIDRELADVLNNSGSALLIKNESAYSSDGIQQEIIELIYNKIYGKDNLSSEEVARRISAAYESCVREAGLNRFPPEKPFDTSVDYSWLDIRD